MLRRFFVVILFVGLVAADARADKLIEYFELGKYEEGKRVWNFNAYDKTVEATFDDDGTNLGANRYSAFGRRISEVGDSENRRAFQGQDLRKTVDHYNLGFRQMQQESGYWLQPEPQLTVGLQQNKLADPLQYNPYRYVRNNPCVLTDPTGWDPVSSESPKPWEDSSTHTIYSSFSRLSVSTWLFEYHVEYYKNWWSYSRALREDGRGRYSRSLGATFTRHWTVWTRERCFEGNQECIIGVEGKVQLDVYMRPHGLFNRDKKTQGTYDHEVLGHVADYHKTWTELGEKLSRELPLYGTRMSGKDAQCYDHAISSYENAYLAYAGYLGSQRDCKAYGGDCFSLKRMSSRVDSAMQHSDEQMQACQEQQGYTPQQ